MSDEMNRSGSATNNNAIFLDDMSPRNLRSTDGPPGSDVDSIGHASRNSRNSRNHGEESRESTKAQDPRLQPTRNLTRKDVAALIINKMIGTGIFTGPYTVLINTQKKDVAIGLWILGYVYTVSSMIMYLQYARKLPFTGGELVYLDDLLPKYPLWAYTLYAFYFVFLYTTTTNAMQFAAQVLLASDGKLHLRDTGVDADQRLLRLLAVVATTAICLLLYVSNSKSRLLNKATALAKLVLLLVVCGFGANYLRRFGPVKGGWNDSGNFTPQEEQGDGNWKSSWQVAFITVLFSFHGWENATLVAGEIPSFEVLRGGFIWAVTIVGALYLLVNVLVCLAFKWDAGPPENFMATFFSQAKSPEAPSSAVATATAIIIAASSIGSMISVAYTCVRVKQIIGWANILPFSKFWRRSGPLRKEYVKARGSEDAGFIVQLSEADENEPYTYPGTPEGGVVLHWIMTVIWICATAGFDSANLAISFSGNLLVYGHFFIEAFVGVGFVRFDPNLRDPDDPSQLAKMPEDYPASNWLVTSNPGEPPSAPRWMRQSPLRMSFASFMEGKVQTLLGILIAAFSLSIVIADCWTREGRIAIAVTGGLLLVAWAYWLCFIREKWARPIYRHVFNRPNFRIKTHGLNDHENKSRFCDFCNDFYLPHQHYDQDHVGNSGSQDQRKPPPQHRHPHYSYLDFIDDEF